MALEKGKVQLETYNTEWRQMYLDEEKKLKELLGDNVLEIVHVGSTSIVGLSAKPIIDIMITVNNLEDVLNFKHLFTTELGYDFRDDGGIKGEYLVRKGKEEARTHFIHIISKDNIRYDEFTMFKAYLNKHPERVKAYQELKEALADKYSNDRKSYTSMKKSFIDETLELYKKENIF